MNYHIKLTHNTESILLDNTEGTLSEGFNDPIKVLSLWAKDSYRIYSDKFDKLSLKDIQDQCLDILKRYYGESIKNFKPCIKSGKLGSVVELETTHGYSIFIHANCTTLKEFN